MVKESSGGGILAQFWVPIKHGDQYILSTCEQPYLLDQVLAGYREVSRAFTFAAEVKPGSFPGLPGRVFISKFPEWTSNVGYYNAAEFLRVRHAVDHEVRGSIALPVFEDDPVEMSCCAVLELVTVKEKPNFDVEMENVCRALQVSLALCLFLSDNILSFLPLMSFFIYSDYVRGNCFVSIAQSPALLTLYLFHVENLLNCFC